MKKTSFLISLILIITAFAVIPNDIQAQTKLAKTYEGEYVSTTIYTGVNEAAGDTGAVFQVPYEVKQGIFYVQADTVTTGDTLKTPIVQCSPDLTNWYTLTTFNAIGASGGSQRVVVTLLDKYLRFIYTVAGASVKLDFTVKLLPK